ncbi:hypothetical protein [Pygmaiobacter massiliensis]
MILRISKEVTYHAEREN